MSCNCTVITLRNETVGGIAQVTLTGTGQVISTAGNTQFIDGNSYSGSLVYLAKN